MAKVKIAIGLLVASLVLLVIYGADAAVASSSPDRRGFLPFDESVRGSGFGGGAVIMSIIAFVIARKEPSRAVMALLFVNGGLIIAGMLALIAQGALASENSSGAMRTIGSTIGMGAILVGLGAWKAAGDRRIASKPQASR
ncbi:hypothetical protein [Nitrososphaera viennensis]|uniref:Uncharacterized protein n=2 Tax=Nitrososphaera viennensis TaxID=1034015 RepID=A0A060HM83_9ARCH|nr:hypothetical protein [Nitrososphaera viennensis]AIC14686.1 hypothetical protein NVIE_004910 [Nitrososphaera viennensis EN76]UVS69649.1 hypothetical protein NWT39_02400 [Nitrososphaera viennensis]